MAEAIVFDLVVRVLPYVAGAISGMLAPYFGGMKKLDELRVTMTMIQARLSDAERHHEGERGDLIKRWLGELKCVMCQLEDLFEEVDVYRRQNERSIMVRFLPQKLSSAGMNKKVAKEGDSILCKLNQLKDTMNGLDLVPREVNVGDCQSRLNLDDIRETQSFIPEGKVIGRDKDRDVVVDMLFKSNNVGEVLSVIPIVGMGGLGKTALAQFVFNDQRVKRFFEFTYWACISDRISSPKELVGKIFQSVTRVDGWHQWDLEKLQCEFRDFVKGNKFLLVLDDVWDEDRDWWIGLRDLLCECKRGSVVLVTTRSHVVALNMSTVKPYYKLHGLSKDQSWLLFKSLAFRKGQVESCPNFADIGREIIKKCANVPLAIRTIAGLLYSRTTEEEWMQLRDEEIGVIDRKGGIMSTLKFSYDHLLPHEKQCFAYCSLYPKDYEFEIKDLIWQWMAQGFVRSMDDGLGVFMQLLRTCFFQDVKRDEYGLMEGCKMHDLMHDLAESVGDECLILDTPLGNIGGNIRHVTIIIGDKDSLSSQESSWMHASPPIRSFFLPFGSLLDHHVVFSKLRRLRVLDLGEKRYASLPDSIDKLQHLRYFKANVDSLPNGITTLQNLQVLNISTEKLPGDFHKLTSLRHLEIRNDEHDCWMPPGIGKLVNLETLSTFVVGNEGLDALAGLNLTGKLRINFKENRENAISEAKMSNLQGKRLTHLSLWGDASTSTQRSTQDNDDFLNSIQFPSTLKILEVSCFSGVQRLSWGINDLPNIVCIIIDSCRRIIELPSLGGLPQLKKLQLSDLDALEFIENASENSNETIASSSRAIYYPSLEMLTLRRLPNLQRWSRIDDACADQQLQLQQCFPSLRTLKIKSCPKLTSMPWSPFAALNNTLPQMLENLYIYDCDVLDLWGAGNNDDDNKFDANSVNVSAWEWQDRLRFMDDLSLISRLESLPSGIAAWMF